MALVELLALLTGELFALLANELLCMLFSELLSALLSELLTDACTEDMLPVKLDATDEPAGCELTEALDNAPAAALDGAGAEDELPPPQAIKDKKHRVPIILVRRRIVIPVANSEVD